MPETSRTERVLSPLRVGLRSDLHVTRQRTRGGIRYVVHDPISFQNHAFETGDYRVLTAIVRHRTLGETLNHLIDLEVLEDTGEDRQGFFRFVMWLHGIGLVHLPITGGEAAFERLREKQAAGAGPWYRVLLNHRIPLGNPDAVLSRTLRYVRWLYAWPGVALWLSLMAVVAYKCVGRFDELFAESTNLLSLANLPALWASLIVLKALHEFGHAYACRRFGAPVPEMGLQLIMLTPCAYVDAGASWKLPNSRQRMVVALGGMYIESFVAGFAALIWAGTPEGFVHDLAFNVVALASVVTLLFNINPLMRYDGYYLFSDLLGVFNLQQRAQRYLSSWGNRIALGKPRLKDRYSWSERLIYGTYGPAAFAYRITLAFVLTGLMATQWPAAGMFLGALFSWALLLRPALALLTHLWNGEATAAFRTRARLVALTLVTLLPLLGSLVPISWTITAPGVLDPHTRSSVRAPAGGFVREVHVERGDQVEQSATLCVLQNPELEMRRLRLAGELNAEREGLDAIELDDPTQAAIHKARIAYLAASVAELDERIASMSITADLAGTIDAQELQSLSGRFLQQGEEMFQIHSGHRFLRILLTEDEITRSRLEVGSNAEVRWTCDPTHPVVGTVREVRSAASRFELPEALTILGGGDVYVRPTSNSTVQADKPYLHVLLEVDSIPIEARGSGLTARVRLPARIQLLGGWVQRRVLMFLNTWRMS
ncbi:MAG: hypothetical protein AB8H80_14180 [Planctomycetota bacterium]